MVIRSFIVSSESMPPLIFVHNERPEPSRLTIMVRKHSLLEQLALHYR